MIPAFTRQGGRRVGGCRPPVRSPVHVPIRPPDDALAEEALSDIAACCTPELGGRLYRCDDCHDTFWHYHCCRNRACPKCHGTQARQWLEERQAELLPCDYFHAVVTVPSELRAVFRRNQKLLYGMLMQVSAAAVKDLCAEKRHLGALPGMLSVLHTWNGQLGLSPPCPPADYRRWDHS